MANLDVVDGVKVGNTDRQPSLKKRYMFTFNNYLTTNIDELILTFNKLCNKFVFQEETGKCGTPHLQGAIWLKKQARITELKKINDKIHWEKMRNEEASFAYCCKNDTRTGQVFTKGFPLPLRVIKDLFVWQQEIFDLVKTPCIDERSIYWYWSNKGNVGKTALLKYVVSKLDNVIWSTAGNSKDIANLFINKNLSSINSFIYNVPRRGTICYRMLENVKDGLLTNIKYECSNLMFNSPHIIVMANEKPDTNELSEDRWIIKEII